MWGKRILLRLGIEQHNNQKTSMNNQFRITLIAASLVIFFASTSFAQNKIGIRFFQGFQNQTAESQYLVFSVS